MLTIFISGWISIILHSLPISSLWFYWDYIKLKVQCFSRILEWVAFLFSRGSSQPRDRTQVPHIAGRFVTRWATREQGRSSQCGWRSGGCTGSAERPRGAAPRPRSGAAAMSRYPTSKAKESQVKERLWERASEGRQTETTITDS